MKTLFVSMILCVSSSLGSYAQTAPVPVRSAQSPASLTALVQAADVLRATSEQRITALQGEIADLNTALRASGELSAHDARRLDEAQRELAFCAFDLLEANRIFGLIRQELPRRYRPDLPQPLALYEAIARYERDLKRRGGRLFIIGTAAGAVGSFFLLR